MDREIEGPVRARGPDGGGGGEGVNIFLLVSDRERGRVGRECEYISLLRRDLGSKYGRECADIVLHMRSRWWVMGRV